MKQASFVIEVVFDKEKPTIIVRSMNGAILKITNETYEVTSFLEEVVTRFNSTSSNTETHE